MNEVRREGAGRTGFRRALPAGAGCRHSAPIGAPAETIHGR